MPNLKFNTTQVSRSFVACGVLKRLLHPSIVTSEKAVECIFRKTDTFVSLLKIFGFHAVVVDERKHISIHNDLAEFFYEIRSEGGVSMLRLMEISTVGV